MAWLDFIDDIYINLDKLQNHYMASLKRMPLLNGMTRVRLPLTILKMHCAVIWYSVILDLKTHLL